MEWRYFFAQKLLKNEEKLNLEKIPLSEIVKDFRQSSSESYKCGITNGFRQNFKRFTGKSTIGMDCYVLWGGYRRAIINSINKIIDYKILGKSKIKGSVWKSGAKNFSNG